MASRSDLRKTLRANAKRLRSEGKIVEALKQLDTLIGQKLARADDWHLTGTLLYQIGECAQAMGAFEECLKAQPDHIEAKYDLGRTHYSLGNADFAAKLVEEVALATNLVHVWASLAAIAPGVPSYDQAKIRSIRESHAEAVRKAEQPLLNEAPRRVLKKDRLAIGYVSAHFHGANYMKPVWPVINAHDCERFDIHLLYDRAKGTTDWSWLRNPRVQQHQIGDLTNREAAEFVQSLKIDVLVDLSSHSAQNRLGLYVHQPAPIAASWFNQFATGGFREIPYLFGDSTVFKLEDKDHYVEQFIELPQSYLTFQTNHQAPDVIDRRSMTGATFAFGCLGTMYKINPKVIDAWSRILTRSPSSCLVLSNYELQSRWNRESILEKFAALGVTRDRIVIHPPAAHYEFLKYYGEIDLTLDTFPYNGGTTTMESIWQGVPVLTFDGDRWASRTSRSLLHHSPLANFVAKDVDDYVEMAVKYSTDANLRNQLAEMRLSLREDLSTASVCDSVGLTRALEAAYLELAEKHQAP